VINEWQAGRFVGCGCSATVYLALQNNERTNYVLLLTPSKLKADYLHWLGVVHEAFFENDFYNLIIPKFREVTSSEWQGLSSEIGLDWSLYHKSHDLPSARFDETKRLNYHVELLRNSLSSFKINRPAVEFVIAAWEKYQERMWFLPDHRMTNYLVDGSRIIPYDAYDFELDG